MCAHLFYFLSEFIAILVFSRLYAQLSKCYGFLVLSSKDPYLTELPSYPRLQSQFLSLNNPFIYTEINEILSVDHVSGLVFSFPPIL
jgi:hypothetical protein